MAEDIARAEAIRREAAPSIAMARRLLAYLEEYMRGQPKELQGDADLIYTGFIGRLSSGLAPSTLVTYTHTLVSYGIHPATLERAGLRIRRAELHSGIQRRNAEAELRQWRQPCALDVLLKLMEEREEDTEGDLDYRSFFYCLVATGGRPDNLLAAHNIEVQPLGLAVQWGRRKVRAASRGKHLYHYEWSCVATPDIRGRIGQLATRPWIFRDSPNIAAAINAWLKRRAMSLRTSCHITSTIGRARMSTLLARRVEEGSLRQDVFEDLMDHELAMSRRRYQVGTLGR